MRRRSQFVLTLTLAALFATPLIAQEKKKEKKKKKRTLRAIVVFSLPPTIRLSNEQKARYDAINREYAPKLRLIRQRNAKILTPEQRTARYNALKAALKAGKRGDALQEAVQDAYKVTDAQRKQFTELVKARRALQNEARAKVLRILTAEQKVKLNAGRKRGKRKSKEGGKSKATDK